MILSKSALQSCSLSKRDQSVPGLDNIRIESDGTVISAARNIVLAIEGVSDELTKNIPIDNSGPVTTTISSDFARKVCDSIENDKVFKGKLEYTDISVSESKVAFVLHDGRRESTVRGNNTGDSWLPWRTIFRNAGKPLPQTAILNRARLKLLLDVLDKVSPESGDETPVYLEFTENFNILLRAKNYKTWQHVLGIMTNYQGKFPTYTDWEKSILTKPRRRPRV